MFNNLSVTKKNFFNIVDKIINNSKLSHAYLIEVGNYDLDYKYILHFVKMIFLDCNSAKVFSANTNIASLIESGNYPDVVVIEPDGQWIKKSQLLKLQEDFANKSILGSKRVYIIKQCDKLNIHAANTMLKFLEEPEDNIVAILLTSNRYNVIDTILSRCQILNLKDDFDMKNISDETLELFDLIVKKEELFIRYNYIYNNILKDKVYAKNILSEIQYLLIYYINNRKEYSDKHILDYYNVDTFVNYVSIIEDDLAKLEYNVNFKLWLDCLFSRLIGG